MCVSKCLTAAAEDPSKKCGAQTSKSGSRTSLWKVYFSLKWARSSTFTVCSLVGPFINFWIEWIEFFSIEWIEWITMAKSNDTNHSSRRTMVKNGDCCLADRSPFMSPAISSMAFVLGIFFFYFFILFFSFTPIVVSSPCMRDKKTPVSSSIKI